jgi:hypothetical protein
MLQLPTTLPTDFFERVQAQLRMRNVSVRDSVEEAVLAVLHRPLTSVEKWAIIDRAANNSPGVTINEDVIDRIARGGRL